jgi:hypothetical protein
MSEYQITKEEIARISRKSRMIAKDKRFLKLSNMRKGESIVVRLVGGWGEDYRPTFGDTSKEEGDDTFFKYEFEIVQGVGEIEEGDYIAEWPASKTYFKKVDPLMRIGHRVFKITRIHAKGERDEEGNILNVANYQILPTDKPDPSLALEDENRNEVEGKD